MKKQEPKSPDTLQLQAARTLVNSDKWSKELDTFYREFVKNKHNKDELKYRWLKVLPNEMSIDASTNENIISTISKLLNRSPSESEMDNILHALKERYLMQYKVKKIQKKFNIPEENKVYKFEYTDNKIDLSKSLAPLNNHFKPNLDLIKGMKTRKQIELFDIILQLKQLDIAKVWINFTLNQEFNDLLQFFDSPARVMFTNGIIADTAFIDTIRIPDKLLEEYSYQNLYSFLFKQLLEAKATDAADKIWSLMDDNQKFSVLTDPIHMPNKYDDIPTYMKDLFPKNWQNDDVYRNIYISICKKAFGSEELNPNLLRSLVNIEGVDEKLLSEVLNQVVNKPHLLSVLNILLDKSVTTKMADFIFENHRLLFERAIKENQLKILEITWKTVNKYERDNIRKWLNENIHEISQSAEFWQDDSIIRFLLPMLDEQNKEDFIGNCITENIENYELVKYCIPMLSSSSLEIIRDIFKDIKIDLYDNTLYKYVENPSSLDIALSNIKRTLSLMFSDIEVDKIMKIYEPIYAYTSLLLDNTEDFIKTQWTNFSPEVKTALCGPLLSLLFEEHDNVYEDSNRTALVDLIFKDLSKDQISQVEEELINHYKNEHISKTYRYWIRKYASQEYIAKNKDSFLELIFKKDPDLRYKILDAFEHYDCLDLTLDEFEEILSIRGNEEVYIQFLPYIIRHNVLKSPDEIDPNLVEATKSLLRYYFRSAFFSNSERAIKIGTTFSDYVCSLINNPGEDSTNKLIKITTLLNIYDKALHENPSWAVQWGKHAKVTCEFITDLLSDRTNNPLLNEDNTDLTHSFSTLFNPIDGKTCGSNDEQILINIYTELKALSPENFQPQSHTQQKLPKYAKSAIEPAQNAASKVTSKEEKGAPKANK